MIGLVASLRVLLLVAAVRFGAPFTDGVVLQRGREVPVWGRSDPKEKVTVRFADQVRTTEADAQGRWRVDLDPLDTSMTGRILSASTDMSDFLVEVRDVLVGEVWIASGQSNMECPLWCSQEHRRDMDGALMAQMTVRPHVRMTKVGRAFSRDPQCEAARPVKWLKVVPEEMEIDGRWLPSAIAYYFAVGLADELNAPVGILDITWGGTDIDAWTPSSGYEGKEGFERERNWRYLDDKEWNDARQMHGPCGGAIQQPRVLWNGMVAPFVPMAIRGVVWYQGDQNMHDPAHYTAKMHALYDGWAKEFDMPNMPFVFAQLTGYDGYDSQFVAIQMAQEKFAREERRSAIVMACDRGNAYDCHPAEKSAIARRFLAQALSHYYGRTWLRADPPWLKEVRVDGNQFVLSFENVREFYQYHPDWSVESGFEIRGKDGVWRHGLITNLLVRESAPYMSHGKIAGTKLAVFSPEVDEPIAIRYLHAAPWYGSVKNEMSVPLGPFYAEFSDDESRSLVRCPDDPQRSRSRPCRPKNRTVQSGSACPSSWSDSEATHH